MSSMKPRQKPIDEAEEDFDFYNAGSIEQELEDDEITSIEEGFMVGYLG